MRLSKQFEIGIEELILALIVILNILDAFEIIGSDLDYIKKIISWAALGYLMYNVKLSKLFIGIKNSNLDLALIFGYFLLTIKNLVSYASVELAETSKFLKPLFTTLVNNASIIESTGIYLGLILLFFVAIKLSFLEIKKPSIYYLIGKRENKPHSLKDFFGRTSIIFLIIMGFFVIFFNLIMEWLAIAIDAPLLMIALIIYLFLMVKYKFVFSKINFLTKFGDFGSGFYTHVLEHLKYKSTFFKSISAMIVLHVFTDALNFLWPFIFGFADHLYFGLLTEQHLSVLNLLSSQLINLSFIEASSLLIIYLGNIIALLFFLLFPVYTWFVLYKEQKIKPKKLQLAIITSSLTMFFLAPLFKIKPLFNQQLFGVDILGMNINSPISFLGVVIFALSIGLFIELYSSSINHEKWVVKGLIVLSNMFLLTYIILYLFSISTFYISLIKYLFSTTKIVLLLFFILMFLITIIFYFIGMGSLIITTFKHLKKKYFIALNEKNNL